MQVDEPGRDPLAPGVTTCAPPGASTRSATAATLPSAQHHRPDAIDAAGGIHDPPALDDDHVLHVAHAETFSARSSPAPPARR